MSKLDKSIKIIADDRERAVIPYFYNKCETKRLNVADYHIYVKNKLVALIERKTWSDLIASLLDGRKNNIHKLIALSELHIEKYNEENKDNERSSYKFSNTNNPRIYYIIEGSYDDSSKIPLNNLIAHLDHLSWRDGVNILYTDSAEASAERILTLAKNISTCLEYNNINIIKEVNGAGDIKISIESEPEIDILMCLPDVGRKTAEAFLKAKLTIPRMLAKMLSDSEELLKIEITEIHTSDSKKIGSVKATKICETLHLLLNIDVKLCSDLLMCVPGISSKTATNIVNNPNFGDLIRGYMSIDEIATMQKTIKTKIGPKTAKLIEKYICAKVQ